jgi:ketol-acid reductoisomerase
MTGSKYSVNMQDKGIAHISVGMEQEGVRFHHATQNGAQFKFLHSQSLEFYI